MSTRQHSVKRRSSGFVHLDDGPSDNMPGDSGIPLANVRTNASTGNRKPNPMGSSSFESSPNEKEYPASLHHRHGRRRRPDDTLGRQSTGGSDEFRLNAMGKLYAKVVGFSVLSRYLLYIAPFTLVLAAPLVVLGVTDHRNDLPVGSKTETDSNGKTTTTKGPPLWDLFLWIEITWLSIWAAKLTSWFLPQLFLFFCGIVSAGTRKYATVLSNLVLTLSLFFWALATWITFTKLFSNANSAGITWVKDLANILGAVFVSSVVLLIEKAIVQLIGVSYHQRSFANRIKESKREVYLVGLLYDASRTLFPMYCPEFADEDYVINDSIEIMLGAGKEGAHKRAGSSTPMRIIGQAGRVGDKVTSAFGHFASEITGKKIFNPNSAHSVVISALEKLHPSEALAKRIWLSFVLEGRDALYIDDIQEVLGPAYKNEADEAFNVIDSDLNGDISLEEMVSKVVSIGKERKAISEGMKDIGQALQAFDKVLLFVVFLITVFIFLAFFKSSVLTVVASAGTALLSLSFIFSVTCQEFLGSCIFLFVKHPYDVGDRVSVNDIQLIVERISLLYTVFTRTDTMQISQVPNIQLNNLWIDNVSRSKAMSESFEVDISFGTSFEDVELLRAEMEKFVRSPENSRDFQPDFTIGIGGIGNLDKLSLLISINHKSNWDNAVVRAARRSKFMCALALALKKVPIAPPGGVSDALGGPLNPTYAVSVTDDWAAKQRDESAKTKDAARMVPIISNDTATTAEHAEMQAVEQLSSRPLVDTMEPGTYRNEQGTGGNEIAEQRQRTEEIEAMRTDLKKSQSQQGRRKAGDGLAAIASRTSGPSESLSRETSRQMDTFDEEAETDMPSNYYVNRSRSTASARFPQQGIYPTNSRYSWGRNPPPPRPGQH